MDRDITELFEDVIKRYQNLEVASEAFNEMMVEDSILKEEYKEWCDAMGYSEKKGFSEFYHEYIEREDSIWDSIFPNKEEYDGYDFNDK